MGKPFKTYNQQMRYLREQKQIICSGTAHKEKLIKCGYFNLINGYKTPFCNGKNEDGTHSYVNETTIDEVYALMEFDDELRSLLFKYISKVEQEVRALSAYTFDNINLENSYKWSDLKAYSIYNDKEADNLPDEAKTKEVLKLISHIYSELSRSNHKYVKNHFSAHFEIPTWIVLKIISFSNAIKFIDISPNEVKDNLCMLYEIQTNENKNNYKLLIGSLQWFRIIRNSCAHNERVYDITQGNAIKDEYFNLMSKSYNSSKRDKKLIDAIVYLKYFLNHKQFKKFIEEFKKLIFDLEKKLKKDAFNKVRAQMGIKDLSHLDKILEKPKKIKYNKCY